MTGIVVCNTHDYRLRPGKRRTNRGADELSGFIATLEIFHLAGCSGSDPILKAPAFLNALGRGGRRNRSNSGGGEFRFAGQSVDERLGDGHNSGYSVQPSAIGRVFERVSRKAHAGSRGDNIGVAVENPAQAAPQGSLADYLAAERTLLAWIRTGLALMGFGFVLARFALFLGEIHLMQDVPPLESSGFSLWSGTGLIVMGVIVNLLAGWNHLRMVRALDRGDKSYAPRQMQAVGIAFLLGLVGVAMAVYLVSVRNSSHSQNADKKETSMAVSTDSGIVTVASNHSVDETVEKIKAILQAKGVMLFALVDHSGEAEKVGMTMRPTKLLIFGSPKAGTPLMQAAPSIAIDLPLKILVAEDDKGKVWISYNSPKYLAERHGLPSDLLQNIAVVKPLAEKAAE